MGPRVGLDGRKIYNYIYIYILYSYITYLLHGAVLLEKLTSLQLVKKFPAILWNPKIHYRSQKRPHYIFIYRHKCVCVLLD